MPHKYHPKTSNDTTYMITCLRTQSDVTYQEDDVLRYISLYFKPFYNAFDTAAKLPQVAAEWMSSSISSTLGLESLLCLPTHHITT
eukprot:3043314-Amphidinium_carterae.1